MSLGTMYCFNCLECCSEAELQAAEKDCLMCCPPNKVIKCYTKRFVALGGLLEDKLCGTLQAMAPTNVKTVHHTSLLQIESNSHRLGFKKKLNASRPSEHPQVRGENVKTFRWDHRLQIQNLSMAFKRVPRW